MATQAIALTDKVATDVTASASLADGVTYSLQALGGPVRLSSATTVPDLASSPAAFRLAAHQQGSYSQGGSEKLYAWAYGVAASLIIDIVA